MRSGIGTIIAEAQQMQKSVVRGDRGQARHVLPPLLAVERVEQPAVEHGVEHPAQAVEPPGDEGVALSYII